MLPRWILKGCQIWAAALVCTAALGEPADEAARRDETVRAVERVMPSVVNISGKTRVQRQGFLFDWWRENWAPFSQEMPPQYSAGSGVIVDEEGYILTNVHVVEEATEILVTLADNRTYPADLIIGTRKSDVALLRLRARPGEKFTPITFAADDDLYLGETVMALGNPFGLGGSVSRGILSSKTRRSAAQDGVLEMEDWLQTDAAINPGNSGGPLVNLAGNLIGLNVAIIKTGQGIGFAIPVKRLSEALGEIFTPEALRAMWFGAAFATTNNGVSVRSVEADSPAEKGGLREGDVVLRVNAVAPRSAFALQRELIAAAEKREAKLQVRRGAGTRAVTVKFVPEEAHFNAALIRSRTGLGVRLLTAQDIARLRLAIPAGLVVTEIERSSPADHAGFQQGLIIETIDGEAPLSITGAAKRLAKKKPGEAARLSLIVPGPFRRAEVELKVR